MELVHVPLLNANEDEVEVVAVVVEEGKEVRAGDLLCVVESTKASMDVEAPVAGYVRKLGVKVGTRARVGQVICALTSTATEKIEVADAAAGSGEGDIRATKKARELAEKHGVDLKSLKVVGIITERHVEAAIGKPAAAPALHADSKPEGKRILVYGASGHAKVVIDILRVSHPELQIEAIVDDASREKELFGIPIVGSSAELARLHKEGIGNAILGIGSVTNHRARRGLYEKLVKAGFRLPNVIHARAVMEPSVKMGAGNQIFGGAIVGSAAELGDNTIINSGVVVSHDCVIGSHTHVSPGAILAGGVTIGEGTLIGMGVTVYLGVKIGSHVMISNGANIMADVPDNTVVRSSHRQHS